MELTELYCSHDETCEGGETCYMGYSGMMPASTFPMEALTHYEVPVTAWGDYAGSTVERSNYEALLEDYPETFTEVHGGYHSQYLAIPVGNLTDDLMEIFTKLAEDYPLYDEEHHSQLEWNIAEESWDEWLKSEVQLDLGKLIGERIYGIEDDDLRSRYYTLTYEQNYGPECEDATSAHFPFHDAVIEQIAKEHGYDG